MPQYMALYVIFVRQKKFVSPCVGLPCECVPPPCENICVRSLGYIVGASPPRVHAAYSALRHFYSSFLDGV